MEKKIIVYGANGYTGKLIVKKASADSIPLHLAGRNNEDIHELAAAHGMAASSFTIDELNENPELLKPFDIMINCAGPFSATAEPMMQACIKSQCHYLDITGEIDVFELGHSFDKEAKKHGIVICPGVGFDVIPTDCIAAKLFEAMPDSTHLTLAFESTAGKMSPGTTKTSIEGIAKGGRVRQNGKLNTVPLGYKTRKIDIGNGQKSFVTIPWGDVSTAGYSTGISNIEVYIPLSPKRIKNLKLMNYFKWLLGTNFMQRYMKNKVDSKISGPTDSERDNSKTFIWGEVTNGNRTLIGSCITANGYDVTAEGALAIASYLAGNQPNGGYYTPSKLCGSDLIESFAGSTPIVIKENDD